MEVLGHGSGGLGPALPDQVTDLQPPRLLCAPCGLLVQGQQTGSKVGRRQHPAVHGQYHVENVVPSAQAAS